MIRYVEDIYADFLYDCYIANQRLTEDGWLYYGREEHHIEIPKRDGGTLGPLNSQYLTTYQHWVAGVLQSEVLQKCCFAFVPKGVLPMMVEQLRIKWRKEHSKEVYKSKPLKPLSERADRVPYTLRKPSPRSEKVSKILGAPILLTLPGGQVLHYDSIKLACRIHSLHPGHLREVAQGKRKQHKGFTAQYIT
jgi:hypothetical protein